MSGMINYCLTWVPILVILVLYLSQTSFMSNRNKAKQTRMAKTLRATKAFFTLILRVKRSTSYVRLN